MPIEKVVDIGIQLMDALDDAHTHGILHRDIKPANIVITPHGRVKVPDFGLAKITNPLTPLQRPESTEAQMVVGTLGYMAPERLLRREADHRADLYAAGALLFEMLTGRLPHEETEYTALALVAMTEAPPAPDTLNPQVPKSLSAVVLRALAREPSNRYGSAAQFRRDLVAVAGDLADSVTGDVLEAQQAPAESTRTSWRLRGAATAVVVATCAWIAWTIASRPTPAQAFGERDWVLIADFDNKTDEPLFGSRCAPPSKRRSSSQIT